MLTERKLSESSPTAKVKFVLPSTYAKLDISTTAIYNSFRENTPINTVPIVRQRERFYSVEDSVSLGNPCDSHGFRRTASIGDVLFIELARAAEIERRCFKPFMYQTVNPTAPRFSWYVTKSGKLHHRPCQMFRRSILV